VGDASGLALLQHLGFLPRRLRAGRDGPCVDHLLRSFTFYALHRARSMSVSPQITVDKPSALMDADFMDTDVMPASVTPLRTER
jgi:hypothetical protein